MSPLEWLVLSSLVCSIEWAWGLLAITHSRNDQLPLVSARFQLFVAFRILWGGDSNPWNSKYQYARCYNRSQIVDIFYPTRLRPFDPTRFVACLLLGPATIWKKADWPYGETFRLWSSKQDQPLAKTSRISPSSTTFVTLPNRRFLSKQTNEILSRYRLNNIKMAIVFYEAANV